MAMLPPPVGESLQPIPIRILAIPLRPESPGSKAPARLEQPARHLGRDHLVDEREPLGKAAGHRPGKRCPQLGHRAAIASIEKAQPGCTAAGNLGAYRLEVQVPRLRPEALPHRLAGLLAAAAQRHQLRQRVGIVAPDRTGQGRPVSVRRTCKSRARHAQQRFDIGHRDRHAIRNPRRSRRPPAPLS